MDSTMDKLIKKVFLFFLISLLSISQALATTTVTYYHTDALGSTVAATDENGNVLWTERYRLYGERMDEAVPTDEQSIYYTGKQRKF